MTSIDPTFQASVQAVVGNTGWNTDPNILREDEKTTFRTHQRILGKVFPRSTQEISKIVQLCGDFGYHLYPVSRGCNWGLGSKVPLRDSSILCDLSRMDQILDYDQELGWVRIQPGVTFRQISQFLKEKGDVHFLSVTGGAPTSSVLANTIERGDGLGPMGDRARFVASLEVVLGDGRVLRTGFSAFNSESSVGALTSDTLGPALDSLFFQSNLGIVSEMTVFLQPTTAHFGSLLFTLEKGEALGAIVPEIRRLMSFGILRGNSFALWNMQKVLASQGEHPFITKGGGQDYIKDEEIQSCLPSFFKGAYWFGTMAVYGISAAHLSAQLKDIKRRISPVTKRCVVITPARAALMKAGRFFVSRKKREEMARWLEAFYDRSVFRGNTSELSIRSLYWRKKSGVPREVDPNRDRCGLVWLCHGIPNVSEKIEQAESATKEIAQSYGLDPNVAFLFITERYVRMFVALMFDRNHEGADEIALRCQSNLHAALVKLGFPVFRLGIQSMDWVQPENLEYSMIIQELKSLLDPRGIIAPGRYDFTVTPGVEAQANIPSRRAY
jgi:4-cresol dehydrogenase (hydroxylating)